jgi:anhydro-N-acetylmuramic acid kinase
MATRNVIGLAAGPCLSGIDAAFLEVEGLGLDLYARVVQWLSVPFPRDLRDLLSHLCQAPSVELRALGLAHRALGESLATAARLVADQASVSLHQVLCVGLETLVLHQDTSSRFPGLVAVEAPAVVAERTGLTTVSGFGWRDLAAGGQGGPLCALPAALVFSQSDETRVVVHVGGLSQVVWLPAGGGWRSVVGWDAGPGSVLLDALVQHMTGGRERSDVGGKLAVQGRQIPELLEKWLLHPYFLRKPPKTLSRLHFAEEFARQAVALAVQKNWRPDDFLCTANHLVARSIADSVRRFLPREQAIDRVILTGAGAFNGLLLRLLSDLFQNTPLERSDEYGLAAGAFEAVSPALLACLTVDRVPANLPSVTGAAGGRLLGQIAPGWSANWSHCLDWMTGRHCSLAAEVEE